MKNSLLWIVVSFLVIGAWWVWDSTTEPLEKNALNEAAEIAPSAIEPVAATEVAPPPTPERSQLSSQPVLETLEASADQILLTVVQASTGEAIPDMEILWQEFPPTEHLALDELDSILAQSGNHGRTNQAGQILLPNNGLGLEVIAQGRGRYGHARRWWKDKSESMQIKAAMDQTVRVFVTLADGRPAQDVVVKYVQIYGKEMSRSRHSSRTNAQGLARLEHLQVSMVDADPNLMQAILVGVPTGETVQELFHLRDGPPKEIRFQLPATGFVKVVMKQANGIIFPDGTLVRLQKNGEISSNNESLLGLDTRKTINGQVLFPVGLNLSLVASTYLQEHRSTLTASGKGPTLPAETVTLNFQQEEEPCFISGRFVQKDGTPISNKQIRGNLATRSIGQGFRTQTEADGHFKLPIRDRHFSTEDPYDDGTPFRIAKFAYKPHAGEMWSGQLHLNRTLMPGENQVGDIVLGAELLISGQVVDQYGNPVPEAYLNVRGTSTEWKTFRGDPLKVNVGGSYLNSGSDGRFAIHGTDSVSLLLIKVLCPGYVMQDFERNPGMADQTLVVQKGEAWDIQLLLDPEIPTSAFNASLHIDFGNGRSSVRSVYFKPQDGVLTARVDSPEPGIYTFKLTSAVLHEEILAIPGVQFIPGNPLDPRLSPIDLRGKIFKRSLHVIGADGEAPPSYTFAPPSRSRGALLPNDSELYTAMQSWEVQVWQDSKAQKVVIQQPQTEVYLESPYLVEVVLDPFPTLRPGSKLWINLTQQEHSIHSEHLLNPGEPLLFKLRADGKYAIHFNEKFAEVDATGNGNQSLCFGPENQLTLHAEALASEKISKWQFDGSQLHPKD